MHNNSTVCRCCETFRTPCITRGSKSLVVWIQILAMLPVLLRCFLCAVEMWFLRFLFLLPSLILSTMPVMPPHHNGLTFLETSKKRKKRRRRRARTRRKKGRKKLKNKTPLLYNLLLVMLLHHSKKNELIQFSKHINKEVKLNTFWNLFCSQQWWWKRILSFKRFVQLF